MILLYIFLVGAAAIFAYSYSARADAKKRHEAFVVRALAAEEWVNSIDLLPTVETPGVALQKGEVCHWSGGCSWSELRSRTTRVNYHGPMVSIPIMKGVRYRIGSISPSFERTTELKRIDSGTLYITNKRIFFDGNEKNTTITFKAMTGIKLFDGGFEIEKQTGRSPHLFPMEAPERVAVTALRALSDWGDHT